MFFRCRSFAAGAVLLPVGAYCIGQAIRKNWTYLGLASVPVLFGIQKISEGFVWLGLQHDNPAWTHAGGLVFLFFALALWPFWFPLQSAFMEPVPVRKAIMVAVSVLALGWFWVLFLPIVGDPGMLTTEIVHHSIQYEYPNLPIYEYISKTPLRVLYFATIAISFVIASQRFGTLPGIILGISAAVAAVAFHYAYVSVWRFFAALLSAYCVVTLRQLPGRETPIE